jgi:anthranilate synthase component 1/salicylate synthetase
VTGDPLTLVYRLAKSGLFDDYVVYENGGQWSFAGGVLAEVSLDRSGARLRDMETTVLPWDGQPLRQVQNLLDRVPVVGWRAYGWAAFELAYVKSGDIGSVGDQRLLHLVVPHTEVRLCDGSAYVRSADPRTLAAVVTLMRARYTMRRPEPYPLDVRRDGADDYQRAVKLAVEEIAEGRLQKVILSRRLRLDLEIDFPGTYVCGRAGNTPARSFLLRLDRTEAVGFSPEVVVQVDRDGRVISQPLAGTRALTPDPAENGRLRAELLASCKEIFEHAISVKTAWDELQDACVPDSVTVEEYMAVRERGSVQHLASRVAGRLREGRRAWDAFDAVFPAVTASGVPKQAAYQSIRTHESESRGLYSGAVLMVEQDGAMDAALVLRAAYRQDGVTWLQAGAGIVEQSRPEREFEETCEKLESVARFLVPVNRAGRPVPE